MHKNNLLEEQYTKKTSIAKSADFAFFRKTEGFRVPLLVEKIVPLLKVRALKTHWII